jgi:HK97 family phage portal protein
MGWLKTKVKGYLDEYFQDNTFSSVTLDTLKKNGSPYEDTKVFNAYANSVWVFACVREISENISALPVVVKRKKDDSTVKSSKMLQLLTDVNTVSNINDFLAGVLTYLELRGEVIILKDAYVGGKPTKMYVKDPALFKYKMNKKNTEIKEWIYQYTDSDGQSKEISYPADQVIFFKYFNPYHPIRGLSPLEASRLSITEDYFARQYNLNFFQNDATLSGVLEAEGNLSEPMFNRLKKQFDTKYSGSDKAGKTLILEGGLKYKATSLSQKDMEYLSSRKMAREEICAIFRVPPSEVGIMEYGNYANSEQGSINFWTKTLLPKIKFITNVFNKMLFDEYEPANYCVFDLSEVPVLQSLLSRKFDMAVKMRNVGYPLEVIDEKLHINFLTDYDFSLIDNTTGEQQGDATIQVFSSDKAFTKYYHLIDSNIQMFGRYLNDAKTVIHSQYKSKIHYLKKDNKPLSLSTVDVDIQQYADGFKSIISKCCTYVIEMSEKQINDELKTDLYIDGETINAYKNHFDNIGKIVLNTLTKQINTIIATAVANDAGYDGLEKAIDDYFEQYGKHIYTIANTEVMKIVNSVRYKIMIEANVEKVVWVVRDVNACRDNHIHLHNKIVNLGEEFDAGMKYPTDSDDLSQVVNCRCIIMPIV